MSTVMSPKAFEKILETHRRIEANKLYLKHGPTYIRKLNKAISEHKYELTQTELISGKSEVIEVGINETKIRSLANDKYEAVDAAFETYLITEEEYKQHEERH
jgi:hypothetical protein